MPQETCDPGPSVNLPVVGTPACGAESLSNPLITRHGCNDPGELAVPEDAWFWNVPQEATATCPVGQVGADVTITVAGGLWASRVSQAAADALALADAVVQAEEAVVCLYPNAEQTATCPAGYSGDSVTVPAGTVTGETQAEADAAAQAQAQSQLHCVLIPLDYTVPVLGTDMGDEVGFLSLPTTNGFNPQATYLARFVVPTGTGSVGKVGIFGGKFATTEGLTTVHIYGDSGGAPGAEIAVSIPIEVADWPVTHAEVIFDLVSPVAIAQGETYWVALQFERAQAIGTWVVEWAYSSNNAAGPGPHYLTHNPGVGWFLGELTYSYHDMLVQFYAAV